MPNGPMKSNGEEEDCLSCKIVGVGAGFGIAGYLLTLRHQTPKNQVSQRVFLAGFAAVMAAAGAYRAVI